MNYKQLTRQLSEVNGISEREARKIMDSLTAIIADGLKSGGLITLGQVGTLYLGKMVARTYINPRDRSGARIQGRAKKIAKFRGSAQLNAYIRGGVWVNKKHEELNL